MDFSLRYRHVFFGFKIELSRVGIRSPNSLAGTGVGFKVDNVSDGDSLLLNGFVDTGVEAQLLGALGRLQSYDQMADRPPVASQRVFGFLRSKFCDLTLVHFLGFTHA